MCNNFFCYKVCTFPQYEYLVFFPVVYGRKSDSRRHNADMSIYLYFTTVSTYIIKFYCGEREQFEEFLNVCIVCKGSLMQLVVVNAAVHTAPCIAISLPVS